MKVGILSMQRIYNYGSFLQAYGLKTMLEEMGCEVEFVDYRPGECLVSTGKTRKGLFRKLYKATKILNIKSSFRNKILYLNYKRNFGRKYFHYLGITSNKNYFPVLDLLIIGSDEVFNCVQANENVGFSLDLFGANNNAKRLISYAASFGNTTLDKLDKYAVKSKIAELLDKFDRISVRDENSREIVFALTGNEPDVHIDPVLAYDYVNRCQLISEIKETKYMILYGYTGRFSIDECKVIRSYARERGLKIYCIGGLQHYCDKFINCSPFEVIAYFKSAEVVITDTFHGSILSIITHRSFVTVVRKSIGDEYGNEEKLVDLLKQFNLVDRIAVDVEDIKKISNSTIDYTALDRILKEQREHTKKYFEDNVRSVD